jgi:hypothetical protein
LLFAYFNQNQNYPLENILAKVQSEDKSITLTNGIEILKTQHPLIASRFEDINSGNLAEVEIEKTVQYHINNLQTGFDVIETYLPVLYTELLKTNRNVILFHNPSVLSFVTIRVHGAIFITTISENETIFFLEEIIHQGSHNTFNTIIFDKPTFFKQDIETARLGDAVNHLGEERTIFSALHGLYTVAKRYESFLPLYKKNIFKGRQKHEFLGRFSDLKKRFRTGLEILDQDRFFTPKGKQMYEVLDQLCFDTIQKIPELENLFDLSNQPSEFSYHKFCELNPIERFNF